MRVLFVFVVLEYGRRKFLHFNRAWPSAAAHKS